MYWGYSVKPVGESSLELESVWNVLPDRALVTYDNEKAQMVDVNYLMDAREAEPGLARLKMHLIETDEPSEARTLFQWSDDAGILPLADRVD